LRSYPILAVERGLVLVGGVFLSELQFMASQTSDDLDELALRLERLKSGDTDALGHNGASFL
jgi:hypothetical protein